MSIMEEELERNKCFGERERERENWFRTRGIDPRIGSVLHEFSSRSFIGGFILCSFPSIESIVIRNLREKSDFII